VGIFNGWVEGVTQNIYYEFMHSAGIASAKTLNNMQELENETVFYIKE